MEEKIVRLKEIPKVELHRHLELSLRHSTIREIAPSCGIELTDEASFRERFLITEPMTNLGAVLNRFLDTQKLLYSPEILERITYEACWDAFHNEGIRILELRYSPTFIRQDHEDMSYSDIHQSILKGMNRAKSELPMAIGLICTIQRILPVREAEAVIDFVIENQETFIGLDLADNEEGFDSKPFAPLFHRGSEAKLGITIHSGEANLPKAPRYVKDAVEYLGAQRIGHGVQVYRDPEIMAYLAQKKITLELCPSSNWLTQAVASLAEHPFRKIMEAGVRTTINSDDPGIFNIDLVHEYQVLSELHQFSSSEFAACNDIAAQASFIALEEKQKVWPRPIKPL
ncbi:MAG: adenosine deaminase [Bdellovibrionales bacterium]|nr:adenosine deaminase [Bdellovibrionales bacterium]